MVKNVRERGATFETGWRVETTELADVKGKLSGCHHSCKLTWLGTRSESASCTVNIIEGSLSGCPRPGVHLYFQS